LGKIELTPFEEHFTVEWIVNNGNNRAFMPKTNHPQGSMKRTGNYQNI